MPLAVIHFAQKDILAYICKENRNFGIHDPGLKPANYVLFMFKLILIIGTGSFLGGVSRFLTSRFIQAEFVSSFPLGTFFVNIVGCFIIGLIYGLAERGQIMSNEWRLFLTVGFCGGFTTFSTFASENLSLLKDGNFFYFALYTGLSVFLGLTATYLGNLSTKLF
jgi:CrcB protein